MSLIYSHTSNSKGFAVLIDPDKQNSESLQKLVDSFRLNAPDMILVGGSLLFNPIEDTVTFLKEKSNLPVYLFPGDISQITEKADGIFLLSLVSGRNPDFLIGNHVIAAPRLKKSGLDIIPTAYMLIENGHSTSVEYVSNTRPIPFGKTDLAVATALAGEMLGMKQVYLEAGSGAAKSVGIDMISAIKKAVDLPLIVGGGIRTVQEAENAFNAGADLIVIGTQLEKYPEQLADFAKLRDRLNS
ncbi:MAG: geranylgeranylglyceryl/heptaprenylglyceryl phosphate synthase [Bacteroidales bacterium]|jgi:phosphoglycerol geranylgeranyltransferase|nr:geranylgeranylglyceryl/heptaprenylglyceryl phosphate synthase [Bacteroidales bacterium]